MTVSQAVAHALLSIGAVRFLPRQPVTFKSGIISPVYVDNRSLPFHPSAWRVVLEGFQTRIQELDLQFEIIAGIEAAGIPHSAALAYLLQKPSVFVRKETKEHGLKKRVEGGDVNGKTVLLIEDLVTTGGSSLSGVDGLREVGATVNHCMAIVEYGFAQAAIAMQSAAVQLHTLTTFTEILAQAALDPSDQALVQDWFTDPQGWALRQGLHS